MNNFDFNTSTTVSIEGYEIAKKLSDKNCHEQAEFLNDFFSELFNSCDCSNNRFDMQLFSVSDLLNDHSRRSVESIMYRINDKGEV